MVDDKTARGIAKEYGLKYGTEWGHPGYVNKKTGKGVEIDQDAIRDEIVSDLKKSGVISPNAYGGDYKGTSLFEKRSPKEKAQQKIKPKPSQKPKTELIAKFTKEHPTITRIASGASNWLFTGSTKGKKPRAAPKRSSAPKKSSGSVMAPTRLPVQELQSRAPMSKKKASGGSSGPEYVSVYGEGASQNVLRYNRWRI